MAEIDQDIIARAQSGQPKALEALVRGVQDQVHRLAMRMLADPHLAQDATQEILIRVVTKLSTFKGESRFSTWVYRIATNYLLTAKKVRDRDQGLTFQMFSEDLMNGLVDEAQAAPEDHVMLNELRLRCTMAMLLCLDPPHRAAYVLGDVLEMDHKEASDILEIAPANYRKRLSRARADVEAFTAQSCGLAGAKSACSCSKRLPTAMAMGRIGTKPRPDCDAPNFQDTKAAAQALNSALATAKLQRATGPLHAPRDYARDVLGLFDPPH